MGSRDDLSMIVDAIDPAECSYQEWLAVGMVLHDAAHPLHEWDDWSRHGDPDRYEPGECARKWESFRGSPHPVGSGTLVHIAQAQGRVIASGGDDGHELDWGDEDLAFDNLEELWSLSDEELSALQAVIDASDDALIAKSTRHEHKSQRTTTAQHAALPPLVAFSDVMDDLPELAPELIHGILRQGHKLTLAGPSKAGKSFALIGLAVAIAEGRDWLGWSCARGPVVYVNLEIDGSSFLKRVSDVYAALGWPCEHADDLYAWNLRGHSRDLGELTDDLVAAVAQIQPRAIILDPAYKLNDGDENAARDMSLFTRRLDEIVTRSGASVIICHHHSKGNQGGKASRDRASGSGVIARDADALIDLTEVDAPSVAREMLLERLSIQRLCTALDSHAPADWREHVGQAIETSADLRSFCRESLDYQIMNALIAELDALEHLVRFAKPLEVSPTLREFPDGFTRRVWYLCPTHVPAGDELKGVSASGAKTPKKSPTDYIAETLAAFEIVKDESEEATVTDLMEYLGLQRRATESRIDAAGLKRAKGRVSR